MKKFSSCFLTLTLSLLLTSCTVNKPVPPDSSGETDDTITAESVTNIQTTESIQFTETIESVHADETAESFHTTETAESIPTTEAVTETTYAEPLHSEYYIEGIPVEDVILYFNEVCLDSEYTISGDPSLIQKWSNPIYFKLNGEYTLEDYDTICTFTEQLNSIAGFPGIYEVENEYDATLDIYFCTQQELIERMGSGGEYDNVDGAVTFWYDDLNEIYDAIICYRTDLTQILRNSVILEEIYNALGPINDTLLRSDSIIYQEYSEVQCLSETDFLILKLLYNPQIECGMDAAQCESVIRELYY